MARVAVAQPADNTLCLGCQPLHFESIQNYFRNNSEAIDIFVRHGVLPSVTKEHLPNCPKCGCKLLFKEARNLFYCSHSYVLAKTRKRRRCEFSLSRNNGTFLSGSHLEAWQVLLFISCWLQKQFCHDIVQANLGITIKSSVDWRSFCSEVTEHWFRNQKPIGGQGIAVEVDETLVAKRKYNRGRAIQQIWLFGGIERITKKRFIIPLLNEDGTSQPRDKDTLIGLIKKFIQPGSIIYSDCWKAYSSLIEQGFEHLTVNHSLHFVDPQHKDIHTQNIERLWLDVKQYMKRPGIRGKYMTQYLGRYMFLKENEGYELHSFLLEAAKLYPPTLCVNTPARPRKIALVPHTDEDDEDDEDDIIFS